MMQKQSHRGVLQKKLFLKISQNSQHYVKTLAQVCSCEFWEIFKNTFSTEHLRATASENKIQKSHGARFVYYVYQA